MFLCLLCLMTRRREKKSTYSVGVETTYNSPATLERGLSFNGSQKHQNETDHSDPLSGSTGADNPQWINSMRADEFKVYENDTITRDPPRKEGGLNGTATAHEDMDVSPDEIKNYWERRVCNTCGVNDGYIAFKDSSRTVVRLVVWLIPYTCRPTVMMLWSQANVQLSPSSLCLHPASLALLAWFVVATREIGTLCNVPTMFRLKLTSTKFVATQNNFPFSQDA